MVRGSALSFGRLVFLAVALVSAAVVRGETAADPDEPPLAGVSESAVLQPVPGASGPEFRYRLEYELARTEATSWTGDGTTIAGLNNVRVSSTNLPGEGPSQAVHRLRLRGVLEPQDDTAWEAIDRLQARLEEVEAKVTFDTIGFLSRLNDLQDRARRVPGWVLETEVSDWPVPPGTTQTRWYGWRRWDLRVRALVTRPEGEVGSVRFVAAVVWLPESSPIHEGPQRAIVPGESAPNLAEFEDPEAQRDLRDVTLFGGDGRMLAKDAPGIALRPRGANLTSVVIRLVNDTDEPVTMIVPAGTVLIPTSADVQSMMVAATTRVTVEPRSSGEARCRAVCLNIGKEEPDETVEMRSEPAENDGFRNLAALAESQTQRGPWDQARTWVFTDAASLEQINERIFPAVTPGTYLRTLKDVAEVGGRDMLDAERKRLLDPALLLGETATEEAQRWMVDLLAGVDPKQLASSLRRNVDRVRDEIRRAKDVGEMASKLSLARVLGDSGNVDLQETALDMIQRGVPADKRELFVKGNGLDVAVKLLGSKDEKIVNRALDIIALFQPQIALTRLATNEVGKRVESVLVSIVGGPRSKVGSFVSKASGILRRIRL
ncbi:MAG: hypothetical protein SNJ76_05555 [Fimbriimonadaceae bacterium]